MSTLDWPSHLATPESFDLTLSQSSYRAASMFGYHGQNVDLVKERWTAELAVSLRDGATGAELEAFLNTLRKRVNSVRLPHYSRLKPDGTAQSSVGLLVPAAQGDNHVTVQVTAGETLLTGDLIGLDDQLLQVAEDCTADDSGALAVPLVNRLRRSLVGLNRSTSATYTANDGVVRTAAPNVVRYSYGGGKSIYNGPASLVAGPGVYGATHNLKTSTSNPLGLALGDVLTISADLSQDAASAVDGAGRAARIFLWFENESHIWINHGSVETTAQTSQRLSATVTLPANPADMIIVGVGIYHIGGNSTWLGTVRADRIMVERGPVATTYEPYRVVPLLEHAIYNLLQGSQEFGDPSYWSPVGNISVETNVGLAPDGTMTADLVRVVSAAGNDRLDAYVPSYPGENLAGRTFTYSVWLTGVGTVGITVNTTGGGSGGGGTENTIVLNDRWTRYSVTNTFGVGALGHLRVHGLIVRAAGSSATVYVWGGQLEEGPVPSSYIPTTTEMVLRAADEPTPVELQAPKAKFFLTSKAGVTYGRAGIMQGTTFSFEENPV